MAETGLSILSMRKHPKSRAAHQAAEVRNDQGATRERSVVLAQAVANGSQGVGALLLTVVDDSDVQLTHQAQALCSGSVALV